MKCFYWLWTDHLIDPGVTLGTHSQYDFIMVQSEIIDIIQYG